MTKKQQQHTQLHGLSGSNVYVPGQGFTPVKPSPANVSQSQHNYGENDKSSAMGPGAIPPSAFAGASGSTTSGAGSAGASSASGSSSNGGYVDPATFFSDPNLDPGSMTILPGAPGATPTQGQSAPTQSSPTQSAPVIINIPPPQENRQFSMGNSSVRYAPLQDFEIRTF